jgi:hypothetical protein
LPPPADGASEAARELEALLRAATAEDVARVEDWYTVGDSYWQGHGSWDSLQLAPTPRWASNCPGVIAVATCHQSGFVREQAVRILAANEEAFVLPFLLLRLNDWVPQVRLAAMAAVQDRLTLAQAGAWVRALGVVHRVSGGQRADHLWLGRAVTRLLQSESARPAIEEGLRCGTLPVRRACIRIALATENPEPLLRLVVRDGDPWVSFQAALGLCERLHGGELTELLGVLRRGNARCRALALEVTCREFPNEREPALRAGLLDETLWVREVARHHWSKSEGDPTGIPAFYRAELQAGNPATLEAALRGLGETGTEADVAHFLPHASSPRARLREAAILGIGRCGGASRGELLARALRDPSLRVAKAAHRHAVVHLGRGAVSRIVRPSRPHP